MTREEAIEILEEVKIIDDSIYQYNAKYLEALEIAIKALEQEPKTEHCKISETDFYKNYIIGIDINHTKAKEYINHDNNM